MEFHLFLPQMRLSFERGVERVYTWFCDFAPPETLAAFGAEVISQCR
jgi:hypothetical protein